MKIEISTEEAGEVLRLLENAGSNALAVKVRDQLMKHLSAIDELVRATEKADEPAAVKELKKKTIKEIWG